MEFPLGQRLRELPGPLLLTGHTGFKGSWMTILLEHLDVPVVGYSLPAEKDSLFDRANRLGFIPEEFSDVRNYKALEQFINLHKPSTIIHMAAQPLVLEAYENPRETFDVNVMGTVNLLDIAFKTDFVKVIAVVTTDKVYRNVDGTRSFVETDALEGKDPYSASKVATEAAIAAWQQLSRVSGGPKIVSVRAGNVIGGGDFAENRIIPDLMRGIISRNPIQVRNPDSTRPWQHVLDPLVGYVMAIEAILTGAEIDSLNFGPNTDVNLSVSEVLNIATNRWGGEELKIIYSDQESQRTKKEALSLQIDSSRAHTLLGWYPRWTQAEAVKATVDWWKAVALESAAIEDSCKVDLMKITEVHHSGTSPIER
jgi:CDP-glucose 4,6-dehydratase